MCKQEITFDKLPQAITYLTEQVAELKQLDQSFSHRNLKSICWLALMMLAVLFKKPNLPSMPLCVKDCYLLIKKGSSSIFMRMNYWHG